MFMALAFGGCSAAAGDPVLPDWEPTWDMPQSTIIMPCNYSGYTTDPVVSKFGIIDYDWSNARFAWVNNAPMDCQDRLVKQAQITKAGAKPGSNTKVFVYRNLVKALPWYDQVREKLLDPSYSGWFLKFKKGGAPGLPPDTWNVPNCNIENGEKKCSEFYHDQEQTPQASKPNPNAPTRAQVGDWYVYNNTNDVCGLAPGNHTIVDGGQVADWQSCRDASTKAGHKIFTYWPNKAGTSAPGACWFSGDWVKNAGCGGKQPFAQADHLSGYRPDAGEQPPPSLDPVNPSSDLCVTGKCDCGPGLPCGEYLFDHRNQSLRQWFLDEFIMGPKGLDNDAIDGFYFDDSWHSAPKTPPTNESWRSCSGSPIGGASEENKYCSIDMGLSAQDTMDLYTNWTKTGDMVKKLMLDNKGFAWGAYSMFVGTGARSLSGLGHDPKTTCLKDMRTACEGKNQSQWYRGALLFELTRKTFTDPFPLPYVTQDVAQFLLTRGPFAWLGHNWMGCDKFPDADLLRPPALDVDYGEPVDEFCSETATGSGVFTREWSKVSVSMDCNTWTGTLKMK
jgi:hypothetical protein